MHATALESVIQLDTPTDVLAGNPFASVQTPSIQTHNLLSGTAGTFQTLAAMAACVRGEVPPDFCGHQSQWIKDFLYTVLIGLDGWPNPTDREEIEACFDFVAHKIKYLAHPIDQQTVQDARRTIQFKTGDCVSKSVLLATLLASLGYQVRFVAQYINDDQQYSHVYVECQDESGAWLPLDPVASDKPMGWTQKISDGGWETTWGIF